MKSNGTPEGKKLHTRKIEVTTYDFDEQRIIVEGVLQDEIFQESHAITGETFPKGIIHHMAIRLLVNCNHLLIEDVDVDLISMPRDVCRETLDCLAPIKGLTLTGGFFLKIKNIAGGSKGCTHLLELLQAMAPAVFQGYAAKQTQTPAVSDPNRAKQMLQWVVDTCHPWREDGPFVAMSKKNLHME